MLFFLPGKGKQDFLNKAASIFWVGTAPIIQVYFFWLSLECQRLLFIYNLSKEASVALKGPFVELALTSSPCWPWEPKTIPGRKEELRRLRDKREVSCAHFLFFKVNVFTSSPVFCLGVKSISKKGNEAKGNQSCAGWEAELVSRA